MTPTGPQGETQPSVGSRARWIALAVVCAGSLMNVLDSKDRQSAWQPSRSDMTRPPEGERPGVTPHFSPSRGSPTERL